MTRFLLTTLALVAVLAAGCAGHKTNSHRAYGGPPYGPSFDRPFPAGQVSDSHWETQHTNAEAAKIIFYDHEFKGDTAQLSPLAKKHLEQVALRIEHVPFPIVIEELPRNHDAAQNH